MPLQGEAQYAPTYLHLTPIEQGTSQVHAGHHAIYDRPVVQKTVPIEALLDDSVAKGEAQLLLDLDHLAIPRIHEAQYEPTRSGHITFVMDLVGDFDASAIARGDRKRPSVGELVGIGKQLLSALEHLHVVAGLVHRDLKPDNIRLSEDLSRAWLIDFNLAGRLDENGTVVGAATPMSWMAPEVPATTRYGIPSELFALGTILYELGRGRLLAQDYPHERQEDRLAKGRRPFPDAHYARWPVEIPANIRQVIGKALAADPAKRWTSASAMRHALGQCVYVDWREDVSVLRRWEGSWPSSRVPAERVEVEVTVNTLRSGKNRGRDRAQARYRPGSDWRRIRGLPDRVVASDSELSHFFEDVARALARIRPAS